MKRLPTKQEIDACRKETLWDFGNGVLYDLCKQYSRHDKSDVIIAKVWLIGRSYSASIERRKNKMQGEGDFYINKIAPLFEKMDLDSMLKQFDYDEELSPENLCLMLKVHHYLTKNLEVLTGLEKRSFSSKYLHFHRPELFPMYDSRAVDGMRDFISKAPHGVFGTYSQKVYDEEYAKFVGKFMLLKEQVRQQYAVVLKNRELDNLLLDIADAKAIKKSLEKKRRNA